MVEASLSLRFYSEMLFVFGLHCNALVLYGTPWRGVPVSYTFDPVMGGGFVNKAFVDGTI